MRKLRAVIRPPHHEYNGNLLWAAEEVFKSGVEVGQSVSKLVKIGYWASEFPEGDGITFTSGTKKSLEELTSDFSACFDWLEISIDTVDMDKPAPKRSPLPSLGHEETRRIKKLDIAIIQLEDAIHLFLGGNRLSAITLAAAADGILSGLLKQKGEKSAAEKVWDGIEEARRLTGLNIAGDRTGKDAFNEWNYFQNRLKHHDLRDVEYLEINIFDHAYYAIQRAIADLELLDCTPKNKFMFDKWCFDNIFT